MDKLTKTKIAKITLIDLDVNESLRALNIEADLSRLVGDDALVLNYENWQATVYSPSSNTAQIWQLDAEYGEYDGSDDYEEVLKWKLEAGYIPD